MNNEVIAAQSDYFSETTTDIISSVVAHDKATLEAATKLFKKE